jgi:hypothetical protein
MFMNDQNRGSAYEPDKEHMDEKGDHLRSQQIARTTG